MRRKRVLAGTALLVVGCGSSTTPGTESRWTREAAVLPVLERLDFDGDGRFGRAEYEARAYHAVSWPLVDRDGDGALSPEELVRLLDLQDPVDFDGAPAAHPTDPPPMQGGRGRRRAVFTDTSLLLVFLADEARAAGQEVPDPPWPATRDVPTPKDLGDPRVPPLLAAYRAAWDRAGLRFPDLPGSDASEGGAGKGAGGAGKGAGGAGKGAGDGGGPPRADERGAAADPRERGGAPPRGL